jgi:hypothetical protein
MEGVLQDLLRVVDKRSGQVRVNNNRHPISKALFMDSKNGTIRPDAKRRITPTVTKTEASTTDTPRARNKAMKPDKKPKDERKNSLWNLKENKENITNNKGKRIDNTRKE